MNANKDNLEAIIAAALETPEGRNVLVQAMGEPIKTSLMYKEIGRKLLMVDEIPNCYTNHIKGNNAQIPSKPLQQTIKELSSPISHISSFDITDNTHKKEAGQPKIHCDKHNLDHRQIGNSKEFNCPKCRRNRLNNELRRERKGLKPQKTYSAQAMAGSSCYQPSEIDNEKIRTRLPAAEAEVNRQFKCVLHHVDIVNGRCPVCGAAYCRRCNAMVYGGKCECK